MMKVLPVKIIVIDQTLLFICVNKNGMVYEGRNSVVHSYFLLITSTAPGL